MSGPRSGSSTSKGTSGHVLAARRGKNGSWCQSRLKSLVQAKNLHNQGLGRTKNGHSGFSYSGHKKHISARQEHKSLDFSLCYFHHPNLGSQEPLQKWACSNTSHKWDDRIPNLVSGLMRRLCCTRRIPQAVLKLWSSWKALDRKQKSNEW